MAPTNKAAYITEPKGRPVKIDSAPYPAAGDGEVIVKIAAAAFNPVDWMIQLLGEQLFNFIQYPFIGGTDVAGTVVEVGPKVSKFKVGDRIVGLADGFKSQAGAFQHYVNLKINLVAPIPDDLSFTDASVIPLGVCTAASGLFQKDHLGLDHPTVNPKSNGKTVLIWAGSSSVGACAIQMTVAAGYEVYTTASPKNFDFCTKLGAARVFDYKSPTIVQDLIEAFKGKTCAGAYAIYPDSEKTVLEVVGKVNGAKSVACAFPPTAVPEGIQAKMVWGSSLKDNEVGPAIFDKYLPAALAQKKFQCLPKPRIVGHGLEHVQAALDIGAAGGLSAEKLVITL
ncbi:GroES-like protein [Hypomontagnella submonticulosa]|nr:GroES-like protein [Hypomontagnella submonticulosa]